MILKNANTDNSQRQPINVVWIKRDIRTQDHAPLAAAEKDDLPYLIFFLLEPNLISHEDTSLRHLQFQYHSIVRVNQTLKPTHHQVHLLYANAGEIFQVLINQYAIRNVFSYQESGIQKTWDRDKYLARLLNNLDIKWQQFQKDGVIRGIKNRVGWDKQWYATMNQPLINNIFSTNKAVELTHHLTIPKELQAKISEYPTQLQPAGEDNGWKYLKSFTYKRGFNYARHISKPTESRLSGGRISPYLAWGNLSIKQVLHHIADHHNYEKNKRAFSGLMTRLKWHCHFIQKFEVECEYEHTCINRGYESLKHENDPQKLKAWQTGHTGYPLVDACMRAVVATGWINFRMRAMLVSFLCHHLDHDWKNGVYHLAQLFLDYEPGIHYPQFQMQAGTTGINTVRIYNPIKQSTEHDPEGIFIKKWVPELVNVPKQYVHEPWKMTIMDQAFCGVHIGKDYPLPIVDLKSSGKRARDKIWGHRQNKEVREDSQRILSIHTRPNKKNA